MTQGNHFCNVDLHVHTPASECFDEPDVTPEMVVSQAIDSGMQAIAITDHNSAEWVDRVKAAASGNELIVFPGVEITVQPGVHVLAIFPEDQTGAHVTDLLSALGLKADARGKNNSLVTRFSVQETVSIIRGHQALPVLAHIDDEKGAWKVLRNHGQTLLQLWQAHEFAAVEIVGPGLPEEIGQEPFLHIPAYYWSSDNPHPDNKVKHSHRGIGSRYSRFKMSEPISWEGLRLCFSDPKTRIKPAADDKLSHPVIEEVSIEGGFLNGMRIELNPNLNCVIGGRGTGKSCMLELLRYAFDMDAKTDTNHAQSVDLVNGTFPAGSRISVRFNLGSDVIYELVRVAGQPPKIMRNGSVTQLDLLPSDLLPIQVYGQKEIFEISKEPSFQLRLLDNYLADSLKPLIDRETELLRQLRENATTILGLDEEIQEVDQQISRLGAVEEEIRRMEEHDFVGQFKQKSQFDQENELIQDAQKQIDKLFEDLSSFQASHKLKLSKLEDDRIAELANRDLLSELANAIIEANDEIENDIQTLRQKIEAVWGKSKEKRGIWQVSFEKQNEQFNNLLRAFQAEGAGIKPERYIELKSEARRLRLLAEENKDRKKTVHFLWESRSELLAGLREVRRSEYEVRCKKADELTEALGGKIRITIWPQGNRKPYQENLTRLFEGSRVRKDTVELLATSKSEVPERKAQRPVTIRGEKRFIIPEIPRYLDQNDLAEAIRGEQAQDNEASQLEKKFDVISDKMRQNLASLDEEKLFELEILEIPDLPIIELQVGSGELGYKPLQHLSIGQKCTALLSLVLLESPAPLLIDQPEDDLDNHFIFDQIVTTLRSTKEKRQFIIATHNANIPVSGDAELILVMQADDHKGWIDADGIGSIDTESIKQSVEKILEGGEVAFRMRKEKYGI